MTPLLRACLHRAIALMACFLAALWRLLHPKDERRIRHNVALIYGLPQHTYFSKIFARQVMQHQCAIALELIIWVFNRNVIQFEGLDAYQKAFHEHELTHKKGILATPHLGSWEFVGAMSAASTKKPFHALAKRARFKAAQAFIGWLRAKLGVRVLWIDDASLVRNMIYAMKQDEWLGFVMDQKPRDRVGQDILFLGKKVLFPNGAAKMAEKFHVPVFMSFCVRVGICRYRMIGFTLQPEASDHESLTQAIADAMASYIRLYPEQWCWQYRRWK